MSTEDPEPYFPPIPNCSSCGARGGCHRVSNGRICLLCLNYLRVHCEYRDTEEISLLSSEQIKKIISVTRSTEKELKG